MMALMMYFDFGVDDSDNIKTREQCIQNTEHICKENNILCLTLTDQNFNIKDYEVFSSRFEFNKINTLHRVTIQVRYEFAQHIKDLFYLDTDVMLKYIPTFDQEGKPYIACGDQFLYYVNGCCDYFSSSNKTVDYYEFPNDSYYHYFLTCKKQ